MLKINFEKATNWYEGIEFDGSHKVTSANHNKELGIASIRLSAPRGNSATVLASVIIYMTNDMEIFGTVYAKKDGSGLNFGTEQREYKKADETKGFADINVKVPMSIQAQVLRYASTKVQEVAQAPAQAPVQQYAPAPVAPQYAPAPVQQYAPAPAQTQAPVNPSADLVSKLQAGVQLTTEEIQSMLAQGTI